MDKKVLDHFLETGMYSNPGPYMELYRSLPDDIYALRELVNKQHIHKMSLYRSFFLLELSCSCVKIYKSCFCGKLGEKYENYISSSWQSKDRKPSFSE